MLSLILSLKEWLTNNGFHWYVYCCFQSEGVTDESKRQHMERLVRDELERWDSESCISSRYDPSPPSSTSGRAAAQAASDHSQVTNIQSLARPQTGFL